MPNDVKIYRKEKPKDPFYKRKANVDKADLEKDSYLITLSLTADLDELRKHLSEDEFIDLMRYNAAKDVKEYWKPKTNSYEQYHFNRAADYAVEIRFTSVPLIMSRLSVTYGEAVRLMIKLQERGIIETADYNGVCEAIISKEDWQSIKMEVENNVLS